MEIDAGDVKGVGEGFKSYRGPSERLTSGLCDKTFTTDAQETASVTRDFHSAGSLYGMQAGGETVTGTHYQYTTSRKQGDDDRNYRDCQLAKEIREKRFSFTSDHSTANHL